MSYTNIKSKMKWTNLVTVEPVMFLQMVGDTLTFVIYQNLFIDKICRTDLKYGDELCDRFAKEKDVGNMTEEDTRIMQKIQTSSSNFLLYNSLVENSLSVILVLFLGVWSDANRRRKPPLLISLLGKFFRSCGLLLNAYFMNWPPLILLLTCALPQSLGGSNAVFHMSSFCYIADSSVPRSRTWRLGVAEAFWQLGSPIGYFLGAYLFEQGGYLCVFSTSLTFHLIAVLYTTFILPEVPQPRPPQYFVKQSGYGTLERARFFSENEGSYRNSDNNNKELKKENDNEESGSISVIEENKTGVIEFVVGSMKSIIKKRPNHTRTCLIMLGVIMLLYGTVFHGEMSMKYLFTRNKFQWREKQFSYWTIFEGLMIVCGLTVILPIISKVFKLSDQLSGAIAAFGRAMSRLCIALSPSSKYLFFGSVIDIVGIIGPLSARSLASKCVLRDERGKVFAFLGCIEALVPLMAVPLYSLVYSYTLTYEPAAIYYLSLGICLLIFLIFSVLFWASKLKIVSFDGNDLTALLGTGSNAIDADYRRTSLS